MKIGLSLLILTFALFAGCTDSDEVLRARIENDLHTRLSVGDTSEKIEHILTAEKIDFTFDRYASRYQAGIDPKEKRMVGRIISIWIYVDESKRLTKIEVRNTYTFL